MSWVSHLYSFSTVKTNINCKEKKSISSSSQCKRSQRSQTDKYWYNDWGSPVRSSILWAINMAKRESDLSNQEYDIRDKAKLDLQRRRVWGGIEDVASGPNLDLQYQNYVRTVRFQTIWKHSQQYFFQLRQIYFPASQRIIFSQPAHSPLPPLRST